MDFGFVLKTIFENIGLEEIRLGGMTFKKTGDSYTIVYNEVGKSRSTFVRFLKSDKVSLNDSVLTIEYGGDLKFRREICTDEYFRLDLSRKSIESLIEKRISFYIVDSYGNNLVFIDCHDTGKLQLCRYEHNVLGFQKDAFSFEVYLNAEDSEIKVCI